MMHRKEIKTANQFREASPEERDRYMREAAEKVVTDYAPGGALNFESMSTLDAYRAEVKRLAGDKARLLTENESLAGMLKYLRANLRQPWPGGFKNFAVFMLPKIDYALGKPAAVARELGEGETP